MAATKSRWGKNGKGGGNKGQKSTEWPRTDNRQGPPDTFVPLRPEFRTLFLTGRSGHYNGG